VRRWVIEEVQRGNDRVLSCEVQIGTHKFKCETTLMGGEVMEVTVAAQVHATIEHARKKGWK
jgi:hypothetical protein